MSIRFTILQKARTARIRAREIARRKFLKSRSATSVQVVFHCCVQKTASRWLMRILADKETFHQSSLVHVDFPPLYERVDRIDDEPVFPPIAPRSIVSPLYYSFDQFDKIPKKLDWRAFFVVRHPLDMIVSFAFSTRDSHRKNHRIDERRSVYASLPPEELFERAARDMTSDGIFESIESWLSAIPQHEEKIALFKYEDLTGTNSVSELKLLFKFLEIDIGDKFDRLVSRHSFERMSGRAQGDENRSSHYRKGAADDWKNHISPVLLEKLRPIVGDISERLGYSLNV